MTDLLVPDPDILPGSSEGVTSSPEISPLQVDETRPSTYAAALLSSSQQSPSTHAATFLPSSPDCVTSSASQSLIETLEPYEPSNFLFQPLKQVPSSHLSKLRREHKLDVLTSLPTIPLFNHNSFVRFYVIHFPSTIFIDQHLDLIALPSELHSFIGRLTKPIRRQDSHSLLVEVSSASQGQKLATLTRLSSQDVQVQEHPTLNKAKGLVISSAMTNSSIESLRQHLSTQGVINIERQNSKNKDGQLVPSNRFILTFSRPDLPPLIKLCDFKYELVEPYVPLPMRCFKCQTLGHTTARCSKTEETCAKCGRPGHSSTSCTNTPSCVNCQSQHPADSNNCPAYQMRKDILTVQSKLSLTFTEAQAHVRARYIAQNKRHVFRSRQPRPAPTPESLTPQIVADVVPPQQHSSQRVGTGQPDPVDQPPPESLITAPTERSQTLPPVVSVAATSAKERVLRPTQLNSGNSSFKSANLSQTPERAKQKYPCYPSCSTSWSGCISSDASSCARQRCSEEN